MNSKSPVPGKNPARLWLTLVLAALLAGCGGGPVLNQPSLYERQTGTYRELLLEQDGWRVWREVRQFQFGCLAVKPGPGRNWPAFNADLSVPHGGVGFYMIIRENWSRPHMGFYGQNPYGRLSTAELDEATITDVDDRDRVLGWEGREVAFQVSTLPAPSAFGEALRQTGTLDFTGVALAYSIMMDCYDQPTATLERNFNYGPDE